MNGFGRGEEKQKKEKKSILTKETIGMTLLLFGAICFLIVVTGPYLFGDIGRAITSFFVGTFGFFVYPLLLLLLYVAIVLTFGKQLLPLPWVVRGGLLLLAVFFIVHTATSARFGDVGYGAYLSACFSAAGESAAGGTGGGVVLGLIVYPIQKLLSSAGAYVFFAILTALALYFVLLLTPLARFIKPGYRERKEKEQAKKEQPAVGFDELPVAAGNVQVPPAAGPSAPVPPAPAEEEYDPHRRSREILFKTSPAEAYQSNLINSKDSQFNTLPRRSTMMPSDREDIAATAPEKAPAPPATAAAGYSAYPSPPDYAGYSAPAAGGETSAAPTAPAAPPSYTERFSSQAEEIRPAMPRRVLPAEQQEMPAEEFEIPAPSYRAPAEPAPKPQEPRSPFGFGERETDPAGSVSREEPRENPFGYREEEPRENPFARREEESRETPFGRREEEPRENPFARREEEPRENPFARREEESRENPFARREEESRENPFGRSEEEPRENPFARREEESRENPFGRREETRDEEDARSPFARREEEARETPFGRREETRGGEGRVEPEQSAANLFDNTETPVVPTPTRSERGLHTLPEEKPAPAAEEPKRERHVYLPYVRPSIELFHEYDNTVMHTPEEIERNSSIIVNVLHGFKIDTVVVGVIVGSSITRYDLDIPKNVPVERVVNRGKDIAMRLQSGDEVNVYPNYEIGAISIEVPNAVRATVGIRSVLESSEFAQAKPGSLTFAVGKNVEGRSICGDIAKMTHLLIAGQTGAGKSVCLNTLLISLICRYSPEELRLILIDPKRTEFAIFDGLPHLMINEIIADPPRAIAALNWAIAEMERRYVLFENMTRAGNNVHNLDEYNRALPEDEEKLPKIVIVVDELADLMSTARKDVEDRIQRLAQKARAAGIHLVLATQRPSVDIITGVIKNNLPSRIAFKVPSFNDSRTILDENGAEKLLGNGDMILSVNGTKRRVQGAFISSEEVQNAVMAVKSANEAYFDKSVEDFLDGNDRPASAGGAEGGEGGQAAQPEFLRALAIVIKTGSASFSLVQRRCSVGYARAGKIIDWMESMGYVSAFDGTAKAREVLITKEEFESQYGNLDDYITERKP